MSTFTSRIRLEKQEDGANPNSWGLVLNQNVIDLVDDAIAAYTTVTVEADDVTLTTENGASDQARSAFIELTGTLTSSIDVVLPAQSKSYFIRNKSVPTPSSNTITIKTLAGSGATVGTSANGFFICDGVSVHQTNAVGLGLGTAGNLVPASSSDIRYVQASVASSITAAKTFTAPVIGNVTSLTDAASIAIDMGVGNNFAFTLAGNRTLKAPTNATPGQTGYIYITQDGTGSRTLAFNNAYIFVSGTAPTISTAAGAKDLLVYNVKEATAITAVVVKALATAT
jgi:hypothetical protein